MPDLMEVDSIDQMNEINVIQNNLIDVEVFNDINREIKKQYMEFQNLGTNLLNDIEDPKILDYVLTEFIDYVNNYITPITELYSNKYDNLKLKLRVYSFICVDCYLTITPSFLETVNVFDYPSFESYYYNTLKGDSSFFKANFVKVIKNIKTNIEKLKTLDDNIKNDRNYRELLNKYNFYVQLMNFGNVENFLENYFKPMLIINENDIIWRIS
jgi:hypothetical protein